MDERIKRHYHARNYPQGIEIALAYFLDGLDIYAAQYERERSVGVRVAVVGEPFVALLDAVHGLLAGPTGRLDPEAMRTDLRQIAEDAGVKVSW